MLFLVLSLCANVAITFTVSFAIWRGSAGIDDAFGADTPARRILTCLYVTIGVVSVYALAQFALGAPDIAIGVSLTLLPLQIIYKLMTAVALGPRHSVVVANLGVVALHTITLVSLITL